MLAQSAVERVLMLAPIEIVEYQFITGWQEILVSDSEKLELMKSIYPKKEITIKLADLQDLIIQGKMFWWWVGKY